MNSLVELNTQSRYLGEIVVPNASGAGRCEASLTENGPVRLAIEFCDNVSVLPELVLSALPA